MDKSQGWQPPCSLQHMSSESPYKEDDQVAQTIYEINETLGAFVAVDNKYYGLIQKKELFDGAMGEGTQFRPGVTKVQERQQAGFASRDRERTHRWC